MNYPIEIIKEKIDKEYLGKFLDNPFKEMIKFVVDIEKEIINNPSMEIQSQEIKTKIDQIVDKLIGIDEK